MKKIIEFTKELLRIKPKTERQILMQEIKKQYDRIGQFTYVSMVRRDITSELRAINEQLNDAAEKIEYLIDTHNEK